MGIATLLPQHGTSTYQVTCAFARLHRMPGLQRASAALDSRQRPWTNMIGYFMQLSSGRARWLSIKITGYGAADIAVQGRFQMCRQSGTLQKAHQGRGGRVPQHMARHLCHA